MHDLHLQLNNVNKDHVNEVQTIIPTEKKRRCIMLDLDATLIHTATKDKYSGIFSEAATIQGLRDRIYHMFIDDVMSNTDDGFHGEGQRSEYWGIERPGLKEFLKWCFSFFDVVGVWSAGQKPYVRAICKKIFVGKGIKSPHIVWTYNECEFQGEGKAMLKDLNKMVESPEGKKLGMSLSNIVLVDDRMASYNATPNNGILIPPFSPEMFLPSSGKLEGLAETEDSLIKLGHWFANSGYFYTSDVRAIDKSSMAIFGRELVGD